MVVFSKEWFTKPLFCCMMISENDFRKTFSMIKLRVYQEIWISSQTRVSEYRPFSEWTGHGIDQRCGETGGRGDLHGF